MIGRGLSTRTPNKHRFITSIHRTKEQPLNGILLRCVLSFNLYCFSFCSLLICPVEVVLSLFRNPAADISRSASVTFFCGRAVCIFRICAPALLNIWIKLFPGQGSISHCAYACNIGLVLLSYLNILKIME